ncbi:hypothetical protein V6N11_071919 [Hibiscus sabdariffa]|uniref:Uncharacterized protein n=1 Tax=Hibiscus sabdariffa TaxID=183260 RepID=A0ABR2U298_9ROSI
MLSAVAVGSLMMHLARDAVNQRNRYCISSVVAPLLELFGMFCLLVLIDLIFIHYRTRNGFLRTCVARLLWLRLTVLGIFYLLLSSGNYGNDAARESSLASISAPNL